MEGVITKVSGPLVMARGLAGIRMFEMVRVGEAGLIGEVIELKGDIVSIQVYEETTGVGPGEKVVSVGNPLSVELGPGLIGTIYDGIQRPLEIIYAKRGPWIAKGVDVPGLDHKKKWHFVPTKKHGAAVEAGDVIGEVKETETVVQRIMIPAGVEGVIEEIKEGEYSIEDAVCVIKTSSGASQKIKMLQKWPVRLGRAYKEKLSPSEPLITGQRVIDTFFPVAKGGTACIPGPFGSGKTVVQHQLAKWSDADIIVYVGCGERGNEMADVLLEFPHLKDPRSGESLIKRTVLIANTSNMPVAAREASVYTGITIAEYFRDMGYNVALMADSTSRWAEAMREMSGRLEEMPGEEGYPAYLSSRIAEFYERAGKVVCAGSEGRTGSLSVVGAVSPPGGDLSDPVVQSTLRIVKVFWSLEDKLAYQRHFPAISWLRSYSLYVDNIAGYMKSNVAADFIAHRSAAMKILQEEAALEEIVRLVGIEALSNTDRLVLETAKILREDFLHQHAFDSQDTYCSLEKQHLLMSLILYFYKARLDAVKSGAPVGEHKEIKESLARVKYVKADEVNAKIAQIEKRIDAEIAMLKGSA
ncbi:MAG: V-type ATP synthase subunit A [Endomicrobiia bacterium]|nr:V-type ATP synthase subunit A [Endomicrobiia bacterium]